MAARIRFASRSRRKANTTLECTVHPAVRLVNPRSLLTRVRTLIRDLEPHVIMVTPSYMLAIAEEFARQGLDPALCSLHVGIFGAEPWTKLRPRWSCTQRIHWSARQARPSGLRTVAEIPEASKSVDQLD